MHSLSVGATAAHCERPPSSAPCAVVDGPNATAQQQAELRIIHSKLSSIGNMLPPEGGIGLYGTLALASLQRVMRALHTCCGMGPQSVLLDVGSGVCRPLIHALAWPGVAAGVGLEVDAHKIVVARGTIRLLADDRRITPSLAARLRNLLAVHEADVALPLPTAAAAAVARCTHVFSFWQGMPPDAQHAVGRMFCRAPGMRGIAVVQHGIRGDPVAFMRCLGFNCPLRCAIQFPVTASGSRSSYTAYVFCKGGVVAL